MFEFHGTFALCLLALAAGTALVNCATSCEKKHGCFTKIIGIIIIVFSIISSVCTISTGIKYWQHGFFQTPMAMVPPMMDESMPSMMQDNMPNKHNPSNHQDKSHH
jgi:hypothetical protein